MVDLWASAHWLARQVSAPSSSPNPLPPWIGATGVSSLFAWLWWTERSDRKEAERLLRDVYKESSDRLSSGLGTLDSALTFIEKTERRER